MTEAEKDTLMARFREGFKLANEIATKLGKTILPARTRVKTRFPFCGHESLGSIVGCDEGSALPLGETFGYLVLLDDPIPRGFTPSKMPFVPHDNVEAVDG